MIENSYIYSIVCQRLFPGMKYEFHGDFDTMVWADETPIPVTKQQFLEEVEAVKTEEYAKVGIVYPPIKNNK